MNIRSIVLSLLVMGIVLISCEKKPDPSQELRDQVMAVHDEVMPLTADIEKAIADLQAMKSDTSQAKYDIIKKLRHADKAMFDWMGRFDDPEESATPEEKMAYYESELKKIERVSESMKTTVSNAQNYIAKSQ